MGRFPKALWLCCAFVMIALGTAELGLRVARGWAFPILPTYYDSNGSPQLAPGLDLLVSFGSGEAVHYVTDAQGLRVADRTLLMDSDDAGLLVLGDSQVLGYGLPFHETFAYQLGHRRFNGKPVHISGSAGADVETIALRACAAPAVHAPRPRLAVIALNLGNDLDEMYLAGQSRRPEATTPMVRWLTRHSHLYADLEIWQSRKALARHPLPGINPILFNLDSGERVRLAAAAVSRIDEILRCRPADDRVILILPSDFQVDPRELGKYAAFSADRETFNRWYERIVALAATMSSIEDYVIGRLEARGLRVVSFRRGVAARHLAAEEIFERTSHHLTVAGHKVVAELLLEAL